MRVSQRNKGISHSVTSYNVNVPQAKEESPLESEPGEQPTAVKFFLNEARMILHLCSFTENITALHPQRAFSCTPP